MRRRHTVMGSAALSLTLGLALTLSACAGGLGADDPSRPQVKWERDSVGSFSVSHPDDWRLSRFDEASSFSTALMFLSNRALQPPCTTSADGGTTRCRGLPRAHLTGGGVLIGWFSVGFPSPPGHNPLNHVEGTATKINGHRAKITESESAGDCKAVGGTHEITATIVTGPASDTISMIACLSVPSPEVRQQVLESLRSVHT